MVEANSALDKIRIYMGDNNIEHGQKTIDKWLNQAVKAWIAGSGIVAFSPFASYFYNQKPWQYQMADIIENEFSPINTKYSPSEKHLFEQALYNIFLTPTLFKEKRLKTKSHPESIGIGSTFLDFFNLLTDLNISLAIKAASQLVQDSNVHNIIMLNGQFLVIELFRIINAKQFARVKAEDLFERFFEFVLEDRNEVMAFIPAIFIARICAADGNYQQIVLLFNKSLTLEDNYRNYLTNEFPEELEGSFEEFYDDVIKQLPDGFVEHLNELSPEENKYLRNSSLLDKLAPDLNWQGISAQAPNNIVAQQDATSETNNSWGLGNKEEILNRLGQPQ